MKWGFFEPTREAQNTYLLRKLQAKKCLYEGTGIEWKKRKTAKRLLLCCEDRLCLLRRGGEGTRTRKLLGNNMERQQKEKNAGALTNKRVGGSWELQLHTCTL